MVRSASRSGDSRIVATDLADADPNHLRSVSVSFASGSRPEDS